MKARRETRPRGPTIDDELFVLLLNLHETDRGMYEQMAAILRGDVPLPIRSEVLR